MAIVDLSRKLSVESYRKRLKHPRRAQSEPPIRSRRIFLGTVRFGSLKEKKQSERKSTTRYKVSMVSIPSSYDPRRSTRKCRRKWVQDRRSYEFSPSSATSSVSAVPSEPRLRADMNASDEEIPPEEPTSQQVTVDFGDDVVDRKSPSRKAVLVNGNNSTLSSSSSSSSFDLPKNFEIERINLGTSQEDKPVPSEQEQDNWNLKDSYRRDLELYMNSAALPANPWADPFESDRRSRTEQWVEGTTPGRLEDSEQEPDSSPSSSAAQVADVVEEVQEGHQPEPEFHSPDNDSPAPLLELKSERKEELEGVEADVEVVWEEKAEREDDVIHDVIIKLNGETVKATIRRLPPPHIEAQDSIDAPPSEISMVSSTVDKVSLVQQNYRNNLQSALEHSGDNVPLKDIERFWEYQYTSPEQQKIAEEKRRRELERIRGHTPTMERVVMYYTSDKRPSLITISPSPVPSVRSSSSYSDAYRLFDRISVTPSPRPSKLSRNSLESEELNISMERDNLAEEITIEVPHLVIPKNTDSSFFHLDANSSDEEDGGGLVEIPDGTASPAHRVYIASPHPLRLRVSRGTSTEDLAGSSERRTEILSHPGEKRFQSTVTQTDETMAKSSVRFLTPEVPSNSSSNNTSLSDMDSASLDDFLNVDFRPGSSSPSNKSVHFAQQLDADIDSLPKHQHDPLFRSPKSILKRLDSKTAELRKMMELAAERLYNDIKMLVEERDRCCHALELLPSENRDLSPETAKYQTNYRDKLLENKGALDMKIDLFWKKMKDMPLDDTQSAFIYSVEDSRALTMNMRRKVIPAKYMAMNNHHITTRRNGKTNLEMASDYARKLADMRRLMLIRRDSDLKDDEKSVEEILRRVSTSLANLKAN